MHENRWRNTRWIPIALLLVAVLGIGGAVAVATGGGDSGRLNSEPIVSVQELGDAFAEVTEAVSPAVVFIQVQKPAVVGGPNIQGNMPDWLDQDQLRQFFGNRMPQFQMPQRPEPTTGQGSGFLISPDGYILTNNHVVGGANRLTVTLSDGRELPAKIVGTDARSDVAVIKVDGKNLPVLPLGDSDRVRAGEWVLAVGSPFGLSGTVTSGIVSATGRNNMGINDYEDFIQTDAAINPGNSGGPLVNLHGQVIGINTAIFSRSGGYQGIGFAIPVNMAHDVCDQLIASGSVTRGYLGILIQPLTEELAKSFGLDNQEGVLIGDVTDGSPADKAGLQAGDVIVQFDGKDVAQVGTFRNLVAYTDPGSDVSVTVLRDGKRERITVEIGKLDSADEPAMAGESGPLPELGLSVQPLTDDVAQQLGYDAESGVVVTGVQPGSQAAEAGLKPGTLIKEVNRQPVGSVREFRDALAKNQDRGSVLLRVREGEFLRFVVLKLES